MWHSAEEPTKKTLGWPIPSALTVAFAVTATACATLRGHPSLDASRDGYNKCADGLAMVVHNNSRAAVRAEGQLPLPRRIGGTVSTYLALIPASRTDTLMVVPQMTVNFYYNEPQLAERRARYYELKKIALECI